MKLIERLEISLYDSIEEKNHMDPIIIRWKKERRMFFTKVILFSLVFYLSLPIGIGVFPDAFTSSSPVWKISWSWLYAFLQVIMTWIIGWIYWKKAKYFDELITQYRQGDTE